MRPFPRGHKGLTLAANGKLEPAGEAYLDMVTSKGLSAKPGDRVVLTDVKIRAQPRSSSTSTAARTRSTASCATSRSAPGRM